MNVSLGLRQNRHRCSVHVHDGLFCNIRVWSMCLLSPTKGLVTGSHTSSKGSTETPLSVLNLRTNLTVYVTQDWIALEWILVLEARVSQGVIRVDRQPGLEGCQFSLHSDGSAVPLSHSTLLSLKDLPPCLLVLRAPLDRSATPWPAGFGCAGQTWSLSVRVSFSFLTANTSEHPNIWHLQAQRRTTCLNEGPMKHFQ